jgi:PHD/YefM family antitoxin component YafN of YafNO toxin-antitoxin module
MRWEITMPELPKSISEARQNLPSLCQTAEARLNRYIITVQGEPQSVLLGYKDYQGLKAAAELLNRPELAADVRRGLKEIENGQRMSLEDVRKHLGEHAKASEISDLATELGGKSGVDADTVATIMGVFFDKVRADFSSIGKFDMPGLGSIAVKDTQTEPPAKTIASLFGRATSPKSGRRAKASPGVKYVVLEPTVTMKDMLEAGTKK